MSKNNYLCIMRSQAQKPLQSEAPSPAQMEEMFAKFNSWKEKFKDNIVDMGGKLGEGKIVTTDNVTDGPFVEAKEIVGGYMVISADSINEAVEIAHQSPGVFPGSSVEVREINKS